MKIIDVNLLPPEYAPESPYSLRNVIILVTSFLTAGFLVLLAFQILGLKEDYMRENARLVAILSKLRKEKSRVEELLARKAEIERRYRMIERALGGRITWSDKLSQIWRAVPEGVWLQEVSLHRTAEREERPKREGKARKGEAKKAEKEAATVETFQLRITGESAGLSSIEELLKRIQELPWIEEADFSSINKRFSSDEREVYGFEITAAFRRRSG